jgi:uncharacterized protein (TIGR02147 family)
MTRKSAAKSCSTLLQNRLQTAVGEDKRLAMQTSGQPFYIKKLKSELCGRQRKNPNYSLRAFAKTLNISSGSLSSILKEKRPIPMPVALKFAKTLQLTPNERAAFLQSAAGQKGLKDLAKFRVSDQKQTLLDETHFKIISEWEYFAFLSLLDTDSFQSDTTWIARRLGISSLQAEQIIADLASANLISVSKSAIAKRFESLKTSEDVRSQGIQKSHHDTSAKAMKSLDELDPELRDFSSITMGFDLERMDEAKNLIREFRKRFGELMESGQKNEVFRLSIQFFPMTVVARNGK